MLVEQLLLEFELLSSGPASLTLSLSHYVLSCLFAHFSETNILHAYFTSMRITLCNMVGKHLTQLNFCSFYQLRNIFICASGLRMYVCVCEGG